MDALPENQSEMPGLNPSARVSSPQFKFARAFLDRSFSLFPLPPQKKTPGIAWKKYQQEHPSESDLTAWFPPGTQCGIAIVTGKISGIAVLDFDSADAYEFGKAKGLPAAPTVRTKRGYHCYYKLPVGREIGNYQKRADIPGIDLRAEGGYVVAPPSLYADGQGQYLFVEGKSLDDIPLVELPAWAYSDSREGKPPVANLMRGVGEGERNNALARLAGVFINAGADLRQAYEMALLWNSQNRPPMDREEVFRSVASIARRHARKQHERQAKVTCHPDGDWLEPRWPDSALRPVQAFDPCWLPAPFAPWIQDISERMQVPQDFTAIPLIVAAGVIIGTRCGIAPKAEDHWLVVPNLWGALVGRPGLMKSPALEEALKPLKHMERQAREEYRAKLEEFQAEIEIYKAEKVRMSKELRQGKTQCDQKRKLLALEEPEKPAFLRYLTNDTTAEKLLEVLKDNPRGVMVVRDELIGLLLGWEKPGREGERSFFLEGWNGTGSYSVDRIGRGSLHAERVCLSLLGTTQPDRLLKYLNETIWGGNDGLVQRFQLAVYPDELKIWRRVDRSPNKQAQRRVYETLKALDELLRDGLNAEPNDGIPCLRFDRKGQEIFNFWWEELETVRLRDSDESPAILEHLSKYRSLMPSLALICHLIDYADGMTTSLEVSAQSAHKAVMICSYLESHARRIYGLIDFRNDGRVARLAKAIEHGKLANLFTARDVYRLNLSSLNTREAAQVAIDELVELGWLQPVRTKAAFGQKEKVEYLINPKISKQNMPGEH